MATSVEQYQAGLTFGDDHPIGQYVNGDYAIERIAGTVEITGTSPSHSSTDGDHRNGWQVDPASPILHGWDSRIGGFDADLIPSLPFDADGANPQSIVKTISRGEFVGTPDAEYGDGTRTDVEVAAVFTVVDTLPSAGDFRPPYFGPDKPVHNISELQTGLLQELSPVSGMPSMTDMARRFARLQLDHKITSAGRRTKPLQNMQNYDGFLARDIAQAISRLHHDDDAEDKESLLYGLIQYGIDHYWIHKHTGTAEYHGGRKAVMVFTAMMLDSADMIEQIKEWAAQERFYEDRRWRYSPVSRLVLWGERNTEANYWHNQQNKPEGQRTIEDPYGWIDGGETPGDSYDQIHGTPKIVAWDFIFRSLMPDGEAVWNNVSLAAGARGAEFGTWTLPDPIESMSGVGGITDCIGRYPAAHGTAKFGSSAPYADTYNEAMWTAYRGDPSLFPPHIEPAGGVHVGSVEVTLERFKPITPDGCSAPEIDDGTYPYVDGVTIRYTTDGTEPTDASTEYTAPFTVDTEGETVVKVKAFKTGYEPSATQQATFSVSGDPVTVVQQPSNFPAATGTSVSMVVTKPTENNYMVFAVLSQANIGTGIEWGVDQDPTGWTKRTHIISGSETNDLVLAVFTKLAGEDEPTTLSASHAGTARRRGAVFLELSGAIDLDAILKQVVTNSNALASPSLSHVTGTAASLASVPKYAIVIFAKIGLTNDVRSYSDDFEEVLFDTQDFAIARPAAFVASKTLGVTAAPECTLTTESSTAGASALLVFNIAEEPDKEPPTVIAATVNTDGDKLTILHNDESPPMQGSTGYSLTRNGTTYTLSNPTIDGLETTFDVEPVVTQATGEDDDVVLNYTPGNVTDSADTPNAMEAFAGFIVTNNSTAAPPDPLTAPSITRTDISATGYEATITTPTAGGVPAYVNTWQTRQHDSPLWIDLPEEDGAAYEATGLTSPYDEHTRVRVVDSSTRITTAIDQEVFTPDPLNASTFDVLDATVFTVGDYVQPGDTGEVMRINSVNSETSITVQRGIWGTTKIQLEDEMELSILPVVFSNELRMRFPVAKGGRQSRLGIGAGIGL